MMRKYCLLSLLPALGIGLAGFFIMLGLKSISNRDRVVSVRGLAEREVKANHVTWPVTIQDNANDLAEIDQQVQRNNHILIQWLVNNGIPQTDIQINAPQVTDRSTDYGYDPKKEKRYKYRTITTVSSSQVDKVRALILRTGELLTQGIAVSPDDYGVQSTVYEFIGLNKIKPEMIVEATQNARKAAQQFAKNSDSHVGNIKNAEQGLFSIESRDNFTPYIKTIRVVTKIDYFIEN